MPKCKNNFFLFLIVNYKIIEIYLSGDLIFFEICIRSWFYFTILSIINDIDLVLLKLLDENTLKVFLIAKLRIEIKHFENKFWKLIK